MLVQRKILKRSFSCENATHKRDETMFERSDHIGRDILEAEFDTLLALVLTVGSHREVANCSEV